MSTPEVTPWFKGRVKPVRPGVYERDYGVPAFCLWDGAVWHCSGFTPSMAMLKDVSAAQSVEWRGLAQEPK